MKTQLWIASGLLIFSTGCYVQAPKLERIEPASKLSATQEITFPKVDILFVVDDSGSMGTYQANLSSNFDLFLNEFSKNTLIDYHIGVLTTSADDTTSIIQCDPKRKSHGCLVGTPPFVDWSTPKASAVIKDKIMVGTGGSSVEKHFEPVKLALSDPLLNGYNAGFLRRDAFLAIIFISDASDQSTNFNDVDFISFLKGLKGGDQNRILSYGALVSVPDPSKNCTQDTGSPTTTENVINTFKGSFYSLCDPDYGPKLATMAENLKIRVRSTIYLDQRPDLSTLRVEYGSELIPNDPVYGWTYIPDINAVAFGKKLDWSHQPDKTQVQVKFEPERR